MGVNILGLTFNNYCLQYVDASFHQVARGLVLPSTIVITIVFLRVYPSPLALGAAVVVTSGFFAGVLLDPNHASSSASKAVATAGSGSLGVAFGAFSSVMSACHAVLIKKGLVGLLSRWSPSLRSWCRAMCKARRSLCRTTTTS